MQNVLDISKYIIFKHWKNGTPITNLKLQKVLYYVQGYALKKCNEMAFPEAIYRWPYGPVVPESYFEYNVHRSRPLPEPDDKDVDAVIKALKADRAMLSVMNTVIDKSYSYTAAQLVELTHQELPWKDTGESEIIKTSLISLYFSGKDPLGCEVQSR